MNKRIAALDGLRGIAIFVILWAHYLSVRVPIQAPYFVRRLAEISCLGWSGVILFFVLSGFLIGGILLDTKIEEGYFRNFFIRRFMRIIPSYWLLLLLFGNYQPDFPLSTYFSFTQNFKMSFSDRYGASVLAPTWSLAVEEQLYLTLPFIIYLLPKRCLVWLSIFLIGLSPLIRRVVLALTAPASLPVYLLPFCHFDAFFWGVGCALLVRTENVWAWIKRHPLPLWLVALSAGSYLAFKSWSGGIHPSHPFILWIGSTLLPLTFASLLLLSMSPPNPFRKLCEWSWLRYLGRLSYPVYLFHVPFLYLFHNCLGRVEPSFGTGVDSLISFGALGFTLVFSHWLHRQYESPFIRLGYGWTGSRLRLAPTP